MASDFSKPDKQIVQAIRNYGTQYDWGSKISVRTMSDHAEIKGMKYLEFPKEAITTLEQLAGGNIGITNMHGTIHVLVYSNDKAIESLGKNAPDLLGACASR